MRAPRLLDLIDDDDGIADPVGKNGVHFVPLADRLRPTLDPLAVVPADRKVGRQRLPGLFIRRSIRFQLWEVSLLAGHQRAFM